MQQQPKIPLDAIRPRRDPSVACRLCLAILIMTKWFLLIAAIIFATQLKSMSLEGIELVRNVCIDVGKRKCAEMGDDIVKYIGIVYSVLLALLCLFIFADLTGCVAAAMGNRCALLIYLIIDGVFLMLLVFPISASATAAHAVLQPTNKYVQKFDSFTHDLVESLQDLFVEIKEKENATILATRNITITKEHADLFNKYLSSNETINVDNETGRVLRLLRKALMVVERYSKLVHSAQDAVNWFHRKLRCCGMRDYKEWRIFGLSYVIPKNLRGVNWLFIIFEQQTGISFRIWDQECIYAGYECFVPKSCCRGSEPRCNEKNNYTHATDVKDRSKIYLTSCTQAFLDDVHSGLMIIALVLGAIVALIVASLIAGSLARNNLVKKNSSSSGPLQMQYVDAAGRSGSGMKSSLVDHSNGSSATPKHEQPSSKSSVG